MILALLLSSFTYAASDLSCQAIYRTLDEAQHSIEESVPLKVAQAGAGATRYEAELRGKYFSVVGCPASGEH